MIRLGTILGIARAELRLTRRLVRYWIFAVLASLLGLASYVYYGVIHYYFSSWSATVASLNPRFLVGLLGLYYVMIMMLGLVFLGFDLRARDTRERIVEALDSRPFSTLELLLGKYLGLLVPAWLPIAFVAVLVAVVGALLGSPAEPFSLFAFVVFLIIPAFSLTLGGVFLVTLLVRHRLLAAVLLIGVIVGMYVILFITPIWLVPLIDFTGTYMAPFPSDIVRGMLDWESAVQRLGVFLGGLALVWLAAAIHPRRDDVPRSMNGGVGLALLVLAALLCATPAVSRWRVLNQRAEWRQAHEQRRETPTANLEALSGSVRIDPGRRLDLDLRLDIRAPQDRELASVLLSLNPGIEVSQIAGPGGEALSFRQADGLVEIDLPRPLDAGAPATLALRAGGQPVAGFAYLDSVKEVLEATPYNGQIFLLGYDPMLFRRRFVALLPGVRWLPAAGSEIGRGDPKVRPTDFYDVDLTVEVPEGWLVAGPGKRQDAGTAEGRIRYRFAPPAPVPQVALVGGRFQSRAIDIDNVRVEVLMHPAHAKSFEVFEPAAGEIREWLAEHLEEAAELGLAYPYDGLTAVEVPATLRGYAGGWRMDTTLAQPAMLLMRETGFPTARFDTKFEDTSQFSDYEGGLPKAMLDTGVRFFENDFNGGNPFLGAARSFFGFVTTGRGDEGLPLDFVFEDLTNRLVTDRRGYFSVHIFNNTDLNQVVGQSLGGFLTGQSEGTTVAEAVIDTMTSRVEVWDTVLDVSLADLDPWDEPQRTVDVLTLKGGAMARSMLDDLGRERAGEMLASLREEHEGEAFSSQDVVAAGQTVGADLQPWLDLWIEQTELPGFVCRDVRLDRITDAEDGTPRYQLLVRVRNEEQAPGLLRVDFRAGNEEIGTDRGESDPIRVAGMTEIEVGFVSSKPPHTVSVAPYLSLNRKPFTVPLPPLDEERIVNAEPFTGWREVAWTQIADEGIVVDDLDDGFSVAEPEKRGFFRFGARGAEVATDQGLPVFQIGRPPARWSRRSTSEAWGKYRRTMAFVGAGEGESRAVFRAAIPAAGRWRLDFYMPPGMSGASERYKRYLGNWKLAVVDANGDRRDIAFDAKASVGGWNTLEEIELPAGEVSVEVSNESDGRVVIADAVRWTAG